MFICYFYELRQVVGKLLLDKDVISFKPAKPLLYFHYYGYYETIESNSSRYSLSMGVISMILCPLNFFFHHP